MPPPTETPSIPAVLNQADLETIVGVVRLPQLIRRAGDSDDLFDDRVAEICQRATDHAAGILYQGFQVSEIIKLFASDYAVWGDVRDLGAGFAGAYAVDFTDMESGSYPYSAVWQRADKALKDRVKGRPRMIGEDKAGVNHTLGNRVVRRPSRTTFGDGNGGY